MAILTVIMSVLSSSAVGTIIGGAFAFLNRKADIEAKKIELQHEASRWAHDLVMRDKDIALAAQEAKGKADVAVIETEGAFEVARMAAIATAQQADRVTADEIREAGKFGWLMVLVGAYSRAVRPLATTFVGGAAVFLNCAIAIALYSKLDTLTPEMRMQVSMGAIGWVSAQASMMFAYWFVARGSSK